MEKEKKKNLIFMVIGAITLIAVTLGATYAYFTAQGGGTGNIDINTQTATTDNLSFQVGQAISLTANQEDFGQGAGNKSGSTTAKAILTANNATNTATRNYYVYLNIESNDFEYTTEDEQAEILLKVTDPEGAEVTTLGSLERKTSGGVSGFDITTSTGLITIADNYEIVSTGTITQEWTVEVIFANLDSDQNANTGKTFSANLIIQEEPMSTDLGNFAEYITQTVYTGVDGENDLYYHDGVGTYTNAKQEAGDNSYRFAGANPNNYVCFGSDAATCPNDNLYRIIGVFGNQVKLIKHDYAGSNLLGTNGAYSSSITSPGSYYKGSQSTLYAYYWNNSTDNNTWSESQLNTVNLNTNYLNNIGNKWSSLIATTTWQVGGASYSNVYSSPVKTAYNYEVGANKANTTYSAKIGLMYASDYGYAASPANWSTTLYNYNNDTNRNNNWMYMGGFDWTISRRSDDTNRAFIVIGAGNVYYIYVHINSNDVRPSFYLESSVEISSGTGTQTDPFRINFD